jgi:hypothetical protein
MRIILFFKVEPSRHCATRHHDAQSLLVTHIQTRRRYHCVTTPGSDKDGLTPSPSVTPDYEGKPCLLAPTAFKILSLLPKQHRLCAGVTLGGLEQLLPKRANPTSSKCKFYSIPLQPLLCRFYTRLPLDQTPHPLASCSRHITPCIYSHLIACNAA